VLQLRQYNKSKKEKEKRKKEKKKKRKKEKRKVYNKFTTTILDKVTVYLIN